MAIGLVQADGLLHVEVVRLSTAAIGARSQTDLGPFQSALLKYHFNLI